MADEMKDQKSTEDQTAEATKETSTSSEATAPEKAKEEASTSSIAEEPKTEKIKVEKPIEAPKKEEKKPAPTGKPSLPSGRFAEIIKDIEGLSVLELAELVKALEDRFGVSAAPPIMVAANASATGTAAGEPEEEKSIFTVVLANAGDQKIAAIKAVREIRQDLGLKEAKDLVEAAPKTVKENANKKEAEEAKKKLEAAGATVELK